MKDLIDYRKIVMYIGVAVVMIAWVVGGCSYINKSLSLIDDNCFEELIEEVIEEEMGIEIDLTPESPEAEGW